MDDTLNRPAAAPAKLPLWRTVFDAWRFPLAHFRDLVRLGWLPFLLLLATSLLFGSFDAAPAAGDAAAPLILTGLLGALVQGSIAVVFLVVWHRLVMAGYGSAEAAALPFAGMTRRAGLYYLQMLLLSLLFLAIWFAAFMAVEVPTIFAYLFVTGRNPDFLLGTDPANPHAAAFAGLGFVALIAGLLPAFYVTLRLSLVLPATAAAVERGRFGHAWRASTGNGWRMVAATVLAMLPVEIFNLTVGFFARTMAGEALHYPLVLLAALGMLYLMAVLGTVLSRCYAFLESVVRQENFETNAVPVSG